MSPISLLSSPSSALREMSGHPTQLASSGERVERRFALAACGAVMLLAAVCASGLVG